MADTWVDGFGSGQVCYDNYAKEYVKITNGTCVLDHSSREAFKKSHDERAAITGQCGCVYVPSEAIALRCVGVIGKGDPVIAFTYRKVDHTHLTPAPTMAFPDMSTFRKSRFIGRV